MKVLNRQQVYNEERRIQNEWAKRDFDREKMLEAVYRESANRIQKQIDDFYLSYANRNGLTRAEANKIIKDFDVQKWAQKAAQAVEEKDFSPYTDEWLRTYNAKMRISRAELLKAELEIELQNMYSKENAILDKHLTKEALDELRRQAGILSNSSTGSVERAKRIVDADFYGTNFSERIWGRNGHYEQTRKSLFGSLNRMYTDMNGYRAERKILMDKFQTSEYEAMRLLRTESARIRASAELDSAKEHEATHYIYIAEPKACPICSDLDGLAFKIEDADMGVNFFPMHPNCRCSSRSHITMHYKDGRTTLDEFEVIDDFDSWHDEHRKVISSN